jgi:hypothetical protein
VRSNAVVLAACAAIAVAMATMSLAAAAHGQSALSTAPSQGGAVLSVARSSVNQVVLLHDLAVGATHLNNAPPGIGAPQAAQLGRTVSSEAKELAGAIKSGKPADVSALASALRGYTGLAKQLAKRPVSDTARLSKAFVATLRTLDGRWRPAVKAIGQANHVNLLAKIAPLLIPPRA